MATTVVKPPAAAARRARAQVLLIRLAGVPEVDVGVDEAGGRNQPVGLEDPGAARGKRGAGLRDAALPDQQVSDLTGPLGGVDQRGMAQQQGSWGIGSFRFVSCGVQALPKGSEAPLGPAPGMGCCGESLEGRPSAARGLGPLVSGLGSWSFWSWSLVLVSVLVSGLGLWSWSLVLAWVLVSGLGLGSWSLVLALVLVSGLGLGSWSLVLVLGLGLGSWSWAQGLGPAGRYCSAGSACLKSVITTPSSPSSSSRRTQTRSLWEVGRFLPM